LLRLPSCAGSVSLAQKNKFLAGDIKTRKHISSTGSLDAGRAHVHARTFMSAGELHSAHAYAAPLDRKFGGGIVVPGQL
jgi:hypothetical protein